MKQLLLFALLVCSLSNSYAQSSSTDAKAAYLLAEESFAANDWKGTLSYLAECQKKLGTVNSKVLYLQIMAQLELAKTDTTYQNTVLKSITAFEKAPDIKNFNEEKVLEVAKTKLRLNRLAEETQKAREAQEERNRWMKTLGGMIVSEKDGHGLIMANQDIGRMNPVAAMKACADLILNGYDNWRLPTPEELVQMIAISNQLSAANQRPADFIIMAGTYWDNRPIYTSVLNKKPLKQEYNVRPVRSF
jgi:hypothetical protein